MAQGLYKKVEPVNDTIIVSCTQIVVSEHMWAYFDFSYDIGFVKASEFVVPDHGEYDLYTSRNNGVTWEHWTGGIKINTRTLVPPYKVAGYVTHIKAVPCAAHLPAFTTPPNPGQLYGRLTIARA